MRRYSPYNYAFNNPIRYIDPDGMSAADKINSEVQADAENFLKKSRRESQQNKQKQQNMTVEQILQKIMNLKEGETLPGKELSNLNKGLEKANVIIDELIRTKDGFKIDKKTFGSLLTAVSNVTLDDDSEFKLEKLQRTIIVNKKSVKDTYFHLVSKDEDNRIMFDQKPIYINDNKFTLNKDFSSFKTLFKKK